jgi:uncharacterized protein (TIGR00290 family)
MLKHTLLSWSSGKDSAWALHVLRQQPDVRVLGLVTTLNETYRRVAMHAVRLELLQRQAAAVRLPLRIVNIPQPCSNAEYEEAMRRVVEDARREGIEWMAFGDLFLQDIREYREAKLSGTGIAPLFPLWGIPTGELARRMISSGLRAVLTCVDPRQLAAGFAGREFDEQLLRELPAHVDPCGERGEFHTFAYDGPMFEKPVETEAGEIVERDGFVFADFRYRSDSSSRRASIRI